MKKFSWILPLLMIVFLSVSAMAEGETKYTEINLDHFGVKFLHPPKWVAQTTANHCIITSPEDKNLQLVFLDAGDFEGTVDDYLNQYKSNLIDKKKMKVLSTKAFGIAGIGAYYVRVQTDKKDLGHILFVNNKRSYALALKTKKGEYDKYEPILMEAARSLTFYKAK